MATIRETIVELEKRATEHGDDCQVSLEDGCLRIFPPATDLEAWERIHQERAQREKR